MDFVLKQTVFSKSSAAMTRSERFKTVTAIIPVPTAISGNAYRVTVYIHCLHNLSQKSQFQTVQIKTQSH